MKRASIIGAGAGFVLICLTRAWARGLAARELPRRQEPRLPERWPSVSIIVPAWEERGMLEACLDQLSRIEYESYEVIVVAGGSDGTVEAAAEHARGDRRVRVMVQRSRGGKNGAMNDAARRARYDVLVFLDADALVAQGWLKGLIAALEPGYAASTGKYVPTRRTLVSRAGEMSEVLEKEVRGRVILQGSGSVAIRRDVFDAIGGIPEGRYADDWALSALLRERGYQVAYAPAALLCSERPATLREWWRNELRWRRTHLLTLFHVARYELRDPVSAAKALYPYAVAWTVIGLSAAAGVAQVAGFQRRMLLETLLAAVVGGAVIREVAGAFETAAYTGEAHWLRVGPVMAVLTGLGWLANAIATLTTRQTRLHFKGPRSGATATPEPDATPAQPCLPAAVPEVKTTL